LSKGTYGFVLNVKHRNGVEAVLKVAIGNEANRSADWETVVLRRIYKKVAY
jgi:hypothetical protein